MIDPLAEELIPPTEAAALYPRTARGKKVHVSRVYRDMSRGVRGVVLESIATPRLATSRQAVARFFGRLSEPTRPPEAAPVARTNTKRAVEALDRELERLGF